MEATNKPQALPVQADNIPLELRRIPRWVAWKYQWKNDRWDKQPICSHNARPAKVNCPSTYSDFETTLAACQKYGLDGVGFVFIPGDDFSGTDLDNCRDPATGRIKLWAWDIIKQLQSYAEVSPSGMGVKVFLRGTPPGPKCRTQGIEIYHQSKYFAMTGIRLEGSPLTVESQQQELNRLYQQVFHGNGSWRTPESEALSYNGLTDQDILIRATRAKNGDKFGRLWAGEVSLWTGEGREYVSQSEADLALCRLLVFWVGGPDANRIETLFGQFPDWPNEKSGSGKTITNSPSSVRLIARPNIIVRPKC